MSFTKLFFAINVFGIIPIYLGLTSNLDQKEKSTLTRQAHLAALIIAILFLFAGRFMFSLLGITTDDFRIGGGIVLFLIAVSDMLFSAQEQRRSPDSELGIVPIGIPLILGPGSLTTIMMLEDKYQYWTIIPAIIANLALCYVLFRYSHLVYRVFGRGGAKALGKISSLFLIAISVMMIRVGIQNFTSLTQP